MYLQQTEQRIGKEGVPGEILTKQALKMTEKDVITSYWSLEKRVREEDKTEGETGRFSIYFIRRGKGEGRRARGDM